MKLLNCISVVILSVILLIGAAEGQKSSAYAHKLKEALEECKNNKVYPILNKDCLLECLLTYHGVLKNGKLSKNTGMAVMKGKFSKKKDEKTFGKVIDECNKEIPKPTKQCKLPDFYLNCMKEKGTAKGLKFT